MTKVAPSLLLARQPVAALTNQKTRQFLGSPHPPYRRRSHSQVIAPTEFPSRVLQTASREHFFHRAFCKLPRATLKPPRATANPFRATLHAIAPW